MKTNLHSQKIIYATSNFIISFFIIFFGFILLSPKTIFSSSQSKEKAIYNGNRNSNYVSLMFNVYWGGEYIPDILNILNKNKIKTTFFVGGTWCEKESQVLCNIAKNGHELGNHGYFHSDHNKLNYNQNLEEIKACDVVVKKLTNNKMDLFAPPSGAYNSTTILAAKQLGYKTIMWSLDTIDWRDKNENLIFSRATKNVKGGDLILMHPTKHTVLALQKIIDKITEKNLKIVPVSQNIGLK